MVGRPRTSPRRRLGFKLAVAATVTLVMAVGLVSVVFILGERKMILRTTRTESVALAQTVAAALANAVVIKEYAFIIDHCMTVVKTRKDLRYIIVVKMDGRSLIHRRDGWSTDVLGDATSRRMERISRPAFSRHFSSVAREEVLEAAVPILVNKARWGVVRLGFSLSPLQGHMNEMYRNAALMAIALMAVGLAASLVMSRFITRPLVRLIRAVRSISAGDLSQRVPVSSRDEMGELAEAFNRMTEDLERTLAAEQEKAGQLTQAYNQVNQAHRELQEAQAKLLQSGRLASIGELAAGVAHEMNNPLSAVLTYSILIHERLGKLPDDVRETLGQVPRQLETIKAGAERCKAIADNLLTFSRQSGAKMEQLALGQVVDRTFELIGAQLRKAQVRLNVEVPDALKVWGNAGQLQQVLTNLAINGAQAMDPHGELTVRARNGEGRDQVTLEVSDTGRGIPGELQDRIFDPFFSTKPVGQGTGLGLSIVYGIVQQHGGEIAVESTEGSGTTFRIKLPTRRPEADR